MKNGIISMEQNMKKTLDQDKTGILVQAVGPVIDVRFADKRLPDILDALEIPLPNGGKLVTEVMQHIGDDVVRSVAMGPTDGLTRGMEVINTGAPIQVPVGDKTLGRMFNVLGNPIDGLGDEDFRDAHSLYRRKQQRDELYRRRYGDVYRGSRMVVRQGRTRDHGVRRVRSELRVPCRDCGVDESRRSVLAQKIAQIIRIRFRAIRIHPHRKTAVP